MDLVETSADAIPEVRRHTENVDSNKSINTESFFLARNESIPVHKFVNCMPLHVIPSKF